MIRGQVGPTFSDVWYRVAPLRARLSPHAQIIRQKTGSQTVYIVEDPATGHYYRFSESAYLFMGMLDGRATVDEAWRACATQLGDDAPTQRECVELLGKLQFFGLLVGEQPLAADMVEARIEQVRRQKRATRAGKWFFFSIPLLNPEPFLRAIEHLLRPLFTRWGLLVWGLVILAGLWHLVSNARAFAQEFGGVLDPANLIWLTVMFLGLRAVHELGHAAACKALGGRCTEIGLLLIGIVLPLPYCDASSAWRFPEVWRRVVVSSAGMIFELFIAAIAAVVWARTESGTLAHTLSYNAVLISGIATLLFNLNPLLRYDGYYILADLTGIPNLAQRSREMLRHTIERRIFGVRGLHPPEVCGPAEHWTLMVYALLSTPYRLLITVTILWILLTTIPWIGIPLAIMGAVIVLVLPVGTAVGYLLTSPRLVGRRARAVSISAGVVGLAVGGLAVFPAPAAVYALGTIEPARRAPVRSGEPGQVVAAHATPGALVRAGDPVLTLESPSLTMQIESARAQIEAASSALDAARAARPTEAAVARQRLAHLTSELARLERREEELVVRAPADGRLITSGEIGASLENLIGRSLDRGTLLAIVISDELVVQASVSDRDFAYAFRGQAAERTPAAVKVRGHADRRVEATVVRVDAAASHALAARSLAADAGGEVLVDPTDPEGRRTLEAQFMVELEPRALPEGVLPGLRARVRFDAGREPLLSQWWRLLRQRITDRLGV